MTKLPLHTPDKTDKNIAAIAALFPNTLTEVVRDGKTTHAIDFDMLRQELSNVLVEGSEERYSFNWPDKRQSVLLANMPNFKTLRPCREESVNFDTTENLYIEGDNIDVLKLLQETYLGKVKMIYIDPPYNTGKDAFVYDDDFSENIADYNEDSGDFDEDGYRLYQNLSTNGRFHTDWLNMMYPRLKVAKDLLRDDGVIFISIDDNEVHNLRKICDEVFGAWNFVGKFAWQSKKGGGSDNNVVVSDLEYILSYAKSIYSDEFLQKIEIDAEPLDKEDEQGKYRRGRELNKWGANSRREDRPTMFFPITGPNGEDVYPIRNDGKEGCWRWGKVNMLDAVTKGNVEFVLREDGSYIVYEKIRTTEPRLKPYRTFISDSGATADGSKLIKEIFDDFKVFDFPKPIGLIKTILQMGSFGNDIILDFFSGSATTAHAVMQLNAEDGGNRKFIMVQIPEVCDEKSEAAKAGYKNICDIGKERIRRAGKKINEAIDEANRQIKLGEEPKKPVDFGFRVLKVDSTNMEDVYNEPEDYDQKSIANFIDNIKPGRTPEDLLFQVMLDLGVLLSCKIEKEVVGGKNVFTVYNGGECYLIACFDVGVTAEVVTSIAKRKPYYAVFRDSGMESDSLMTSFEQIFEAYSKTTVRRVL